MMRKIAKYAKAIGLTLFGILGFAFGGTLLLVVALIGLISLFDKTSDASLKDKLMWLFGGGSGLAMLWMAFYTNVEYVFDAWIDALNDFDSDEIVIESRMDDLAD